MTYPVKTTESLASQNHTLVRLNLGSGTFYMDGWVNVDVGDNKADLVLPDWEELPFAPGSATVAYLGHLLERLPLYLCHRVLSLVREIVVPGAPIVVCCVDTLKVKRMYVSGRLGDVEFARAMGRMVGWETEIPTITKLLEETGWESIGKVQGTMSPNSTWPVAVWYQSPLDAVLVAQRPKE
jgi:hypothetical protein